MWRPTPGRRRLASLREGKPGVQEREELRDVRVAGRGGGEGQVVGAAGTDATEVLRLAASLDQGSEHPLAETIVAEARQRGLDLSKPQDFDSVTGSGVRGTVEGRALLLGNRASLWLRRREADRG